MRATTTSVEDYLRKEMLKANRLWEDDKLTEIIDHLASLNSHEHLNDLETGKRQKKTHSAKHNKKITWEK